MKILAFIGKIFNYFELQNEVGLTMKNKTWFLYFKVIFLLFTSLGYTIVIGQKSEFNPYKFSADIFEQIKTDSGYYWSGGVASSDLSFIGLYKEAIIEYDKPRQSKKTISRTDSANFVSSYHITDAKQFILKKAKENQILIFNEAHHNPRNRVFVTSLLADLKNEGYTYFAAEAFMNDTAFLKDKHPDISPNSYYTCEPQFGNLVREAVKLGYSLYPYEYMGTTKGFREMGEAKNIELLLKKDPHARIIIYCGYDHAKEDSVKGWGKAMAGRLKDITGIDPYTIDQIVLSEKYDSAWDNPYFKMVRSDKYSIPEDKTGDAFNNHSMDALLYSPRTKYIYNRPGWIFENGKNPYFLEESKITSAYPILVKAYINATDFKNEVPIDIIEIKNKEDVSKTAIALFRKGNFTIKILNKAGKTQLFKVQK